MQAIGNNQHQSYSLSIRLHADGFSFYSYNPNELDAIKEESFRYNNKESHAETFEKALAQSMLTKNNRYMCVYGLVVGKSIQIPLEAFHKEEANTLFRLTFAQEQAGKIYYNILPHLEIAKVFSIEKDIEMLLCKHFPGIRFYHAETMLLENMLPSETQDKQRLYVYFHEQDLFIFHYKEQKLHYANTFPAGQADNIAYFILSVWKNLNLDNLEGECILLGKNENLVACIKILGKYLHCVKSLSSSDIYRRYSPARNTHYPLDLLALFINVI